MIKYRADTLHNKVKSLEVVRETTQTVWYKYVPCTGKPQEIQERLTGSYHMWFNTFEEAKQYLTVRMTDFLNRYEDIVIRTRKTVEELTNLKEEECSNQI